MRLFELFPDDDQPLKPNSGGEMKEQLRQAALDLITPLLGQNVPFVTMQQVIDSLSGSRFGIVITPSLVMDILNPTEVKAVEKIEGGRVYLADLNSADPDREVDQDQAEKDDQTVDDMAASQANKQMKQPPPAVPPQQ